MSITMGFIVALVAISIIVFFSVQIQKITLSLFQKLTKKVGIRVQNSEIRLQRYIFTHYESIIAKMYRWVNEQIIILGLKRYNVSPTGFIAFWCIIAIPLTVGIGVFFKITAVFSVVVYVVIVTLLLMITRMRTASSIEKREEIIMTTIDMLVPDIGSGVQNAINKYIDIIPGEIRDDFKSFIDRIVRKTTPFNESMIILADNIGGSVFKDFAQKAIFYEENGNKDSLEIFSDIVETNRLRRELRYENKKIFDYCKSDFITASIVVWGYVLVFGFRESFTKNFILNTTFGQASLILDIVIELAVLMFITSIRSREI